MFFIIKIDISISRLVQFTQTGLSDRIPDFQLYLVSLTEDQSEKFCLEFTTQMTDFYEMLSNF